MSHTDAFALKNSGLNEFLFAEVGTELNGSPLTVLSVLARLGQDPWAVAAKWVKLPKAITIDSLASSISQMPLCPKALVEAPATATRLVLLLPSQIQSPQNGQKPTAVIPNTVSKWLPKVLLVVLALALAFSLLRPAPRPDAVNSLMQPLSDHPGGHPGAPTN
jgi:hypothetical protein